MAHCSLQLEKRRVLGNKIKANNASAITAKNPLVIVMPADNTEIYHEGQDVYFLHPEESWIKGTITEVVHTKLKSGAMEVSYSCQGYPEKTLLPTITGAGAIVPKLPPSSIHPVVNTGAAAGGEDGGGDKKGVTFFSDGRDTYSDLLDLSYLHDSTLLEQVRKRYFANLIYTRIGPIVLALNPYDYALPNYVDSNMPTYIAEGSIIVANAGKSQLIPHAWSTAHYSYWLLSNGEQRSNQSVIVSGESGAGKTETAKIVVKYLGKVSTSQCSDTVREAATQVTARVNLTSPILEAFGNAKTKKNDNSSRFGKFMKVHFSLPREMSGAGGVMVGVSIDVYLLEKSRVITHGEGERAYHCFYQLLSKPQAKAQEKDALLNSLHLGGADDYGSLNVGKATVIPGVDDASDWQEVVNAMYAVGLSSNEESSVWKIVASVLHLLDVKISALSHDECEIEGMEAGGGGGGGGAPMGRKRSQSMAPGRDVPSADRAAKNQKHMNAVQEIIGIDMNIFATELITTKSIIQGETIVRKLKKAAAIDVRDAICKYMYEALFLWLVGKINGLISPPAEAKDTWIALLDIFGFENFQHNSFEQMCINLANETLQNHYNSVVFTRDMAECHNEGINTASVTFYDNQPCLDMVCGVNFSMCGLPQQKGSIVTSKLSITSLLDDESSLGNGSDLSFCSKLDDAFGAKGTKAAHPNFEKPKTQNNAFIIKHYAGNVKYSVEGFRAKNADTTKETLKELLSTSPNAFVAGLVTHYQTVQQEALAQTQSSGLGMKSSNTVSAFFKNQLVRLMTEINKTHPHWIRCVKPHSAKKPRMFCGEEVMSQMRSAGVLETVRIRQQSFSIRLPFSEFLTGPASLFLRKMPQHTLNSLAERSGVLSEAANAARKALEEASAANATVGKIKDLTYKLEVAQQTASALKTVVTEMKATNGSTVGGDAPEKCRVILRRCGVDSHELAQVGTTKIFMRAPAFQQVHRQETEIKTGLANIILANARARESNSKVRCLQLDHYVRLIGSCLRARASSVDMRKKELVVLQKDLITRFRDLLLAESEETRVRDAMLQQEVTVFEFIAQQQARELTAMRAAWLEAMASKHFEERQMVEDAEAAARALKIIGSEARERLVLSDLLNIFDDEAEGRMGVEADEEDERENHLGYEASKLFEAVKEARILAAQLALRKCEGRYDEGRHAVVEAYMLLTGAYANEEQVQREEIAHRCLVTEEEDYEWSRDIIYEHERGWAKQRLLWNEQQAARTSRLIRLLMRHETTARAEIEVMYEQLLIGIYTRVDASLEEVNELIAQRLAREAHARRVAAKEKQRAEQERYERWVNEQREIAKAIWAAAKEAENEVLLKEKEKQRAFEMRAVEAQKVRERIRAQQEREVLGRGKGVKPLPGFALGLPKKMPSQGSPQSFASKTAAASPSRSLYANPNADAMSPSAPESAMSPYPRSPSHTAAPTAGTGSANDKFRLLMAKFEAVSSSDLTPRSKRSLRLQLARGTDSLPERAASPPTKEMEERYGPTGLLLSNSDDDYQPAVDTREGSPINTDSSVPLDHSHRRLMTRFDSGSSPLGRFRDHHGSVSPTGRTDTNAHHLSPFGTNYTGTSARLHPTSLESEAPTLFSLSRTGITAVPTQHNKNKALTPSVFDKVSTNPFDPTWRPVEGGTKAYLPDGSLVDIA